MECLLFTFGFLLMFGKGHSEIHSILPCLYRPLPAVGLFDPRFKWQQFVSRGKDLTLEEVERFFARNHAPVLPRALQYTSFLPDTASVLMTTVDEPEDSFTLYTIWKECCAELERNILSSEDPPKVYIFCTPL